MRRVSNIKILWLTLFVSLLDNIKMIININDKFRFINELFEANATEYNIAVEQMNSVNSLDEMMSYLKGLTSIYEWKEDSEVVKNLFALAQKRFS